MVEGLRFGVWVCRVPGSGCRSRFQGSGFRFQHLGFGVWDSRVQG